ncbi:hypothetical protein DHEL01_v201629 [Diaporthe helianthi]|uniref:Myb-like domain-containing protein n=1 Tax=Diaporthe helianthi TaxID=158607 RepID=A0A2P5IBU0_DIAHE|nr:hypothetical protein DHEL01_v201629 [Diaporthe helianthi]
MADPEVPARTKPKRKRCDTPLDPEEVAEGIMDELEKSRDSIDKKLAKYSDSILQAQSNKRQRFIDYCKSKIRGLPDGVRSSVATTLLSSEDFAVKMNFSELHTSSSTSSLTWSCGGTSLSDPSWKKLLQQYTKGASESSSPSTGMLAQSSRTTNKSSSPPARASPRLPEPAGSSTSTAWPEDHEDPYAVPEDQDPLSIQRVTISKTRKKPTNTGPQEAPHNHEAGPRKVPRATPSSQTTPAPSEDRSPRYWTKEETSTLRALCARKPEARSEAKSAFWKGVQAQMPRRTQAACCAKWRAMRANRKPWAGDDVATTTSSSSRRPHKTWSPEDLARLEQIRPRDPGAHIDWNRAMVLFPERTISSIAAKCSRQFGTWYEYRRM